MTEEQKKTYLAKKGVACLYCGSNNLTAGRPETSDCVIYVNVICDDCQKHWRDTFSITDVIENDE